MRNLYDAHAVLATTRMKILRGKIPERQANLFEIVQTGEALAFRLGPGQRRQEQPGEKGDDGNHHEEFNQSKCLRPPFDRR